MTRAVVATGFGGPEMLAVVNADPGVMGPYDVLVQVRAAGVNPADWKAYSGAWTTDPTVLPMRLGSEAAGVVLMHGREVSGVQVGDEVIVYPAHGAYAEQILVPADAVLPKPASMSWEKAAGLMVAGVTAVHALTATGVGAGDTVLVHGASGGVGAMLVQLAHCRGARVVGTASPANHEYLTDLGATPVAYGPGLTERVRTLGTITAAIDAAGTTEALETSVALAPHGRIATLAGHALGAKLGIQLLGGGEGSDPGTEIRMAARHKLLRLWEAGKIDVRVGATYRLTEARRAHRAGIDGHVTGKIVLLP
ncbi:NADP-dependent oxidoreductase [Isoptericola sp. b441]|uniref:NADP-dependent oxidoreductase n=1 Tax=Actinotalea lenta TaxID=3064654 RepID=A0ABT9DCI5_9CELL|nr:MULTISPECIES: NADP-dependent oxidoreductase [unclassified Isoptericola]MDO8106632.1 NADP-dependent oxidoreductase [Isoptericola sp. b441]MDO8121660.1 NADP-dependent oxidoreductase [Isoptericola sp. b490]